MTYESIYKTEELNVEKLKKANLKKINTIYIFNSTCLFSDIVLNIIGIIPARGGSKGIPRKNIKLLGGKPLIKHTIDSANNSKLLKDFYVSSEDDEIISIVKSYNVKIIIRPKELAEDSTPMVPVLQHAINFLEPKIGRIDILVLLQPTAPFRLGKDIDGAIKLLQETEADSVITLVKVSDCHPARMYRLEENKVHSLWGDKYKFLMRQEFPPIYLRNGAVYAFTRHTIMEQQAQEREDSRGLVMPPERSINIDEPIDFELAEIILKKLN